MWFVIAKPTNYYALHIVLVMTYVTNFEHENNVEDILYTLEHFTNIWNVHVKLANNSTCLLYVL